MPWLRPNKKNKPVSGNGSENFRKGLHTYFYALKGTLGGKK